MRIPVYPSDLNDRKHGFKRLTKWLLKRLPEGTSISHMQLHDILAKGFGYSPKLVMSILSLGIAARPAEWTTKSSILL